MDWCQYGRSGIRCTGLPSERLYTKELIGLTMDMMEIVENVIYITFLVSQKNMIPSMTSLPSLLRRRPGLTDRHFMYTVSCVKTTLAPPTEKLRRFFCMPINTRLLFSWRNTMIVLELNYLKMEIFVSEHCDVIRVSIYEVLGLRGPPFNFQGEGAGVFLK